MNKNNDNGLADIYNIVNECIIYLLNCFMLATLPGCTQPLGHFRSWRKDLRGRYADWLSSAGPLNADKWIQGCRIGIHRPNGRENNLFGRSQLPPAKHCFLGCWMIGQKDLWDERENLKVLKEDPLGILCELRNKWESKANGQQLLFWVVHMWKHCLAWMCELLRSGIFTFPQLFGIFTFWRGKVQVHWKSLLCVLHCDWCCCWPLLSSNPHKSVGPTVQGIATLANNWRLFIRKTGEFCCKRNMVRFSTVSYYSVPYDEWEVQRQEGQCEQPWGQKNHLGEELVWMRAEMYRRQVDADGWIVQADDAEIDA